jgi:Holliday junction resolvase RusA-like endonuclease
VTTDLDMEYAEAVLRWSYAYKPTVVYADSIPLVASPPLVAKQKGVFHFRAPFFVTFQVPGVPVAKGRARATVQGGKARMYTPAKTRAYEDLVRCAAARAMLENSPVEGAVVVTVTAFLSVPKSFGKAERAMCLDGRIKPTTRPDADNYAKAALDGCNGILFRDDSQIADLIVRKRYSATPRLVITMETEEL